MLPACEELGIGFVPFSPLGRGYLTGKIDENTTFASVDIRSRLPRYTPEALKANRVVIDLLARIGEAEGRDTGSDRARLAARSEAVDCSHPGQPEARAPG